MNLSNSVCIGQSVRHIGALLSLALAPLAFAQPVNWVGPASGASAVWSNAANWSGGVPTESSDVVFAGALNNTAVMRNSTVDTAISLNSLTLDNSTGNLNATVFRIIGSGGTLLFNSNNQTIINVINSTAFINSSSNVSTLTVNLNYSHRRTT